MEDLVSLIPEDNNFGEAVNSVVSLNKKIENFLPATHSHIHIIFEIA